MSSLSNAQLELLRLFSDDLSDRELLELKQVLAAWKLRKATEAANEVWDKKGWSEEDAKRLLSTHMRTPYTSYRAYLQKKQAES